MGRTVRWVVRVVGSLVACMAGPAAAQAQDFLLQQDYWVVEGTPSVLITITRTGPGPDTDVFWKTVDGSAVGGFDFGAVAFSSVHFGTSDTSRTFSVSILNDGTSEPSTGVQDEVFYVELTSVSGSGTILDGRASVTITDDDRFMPGVQFLTVVSDGTSTSGRNRLQWRVPAGQPNAPTQFHIRWDNGPTCTFPASTSEGVGGSGNFTAGAPGAVQSYVHSIVAPPHQIWCYSVFTFFPAQSPQIVTVKAKTFDSNGPLKWTYTNSSALPNVAPPTVGQDAIYTVDNDGVLHAMLRSGVNAGAWPSTWHPVDLGLGAHNRSPVVPLTTLGWRLFIGTENGEVHSVDGQTGTIIWSRSQPFNTSQLMPGLSTGTQATPALLLQKYGGRNDILLVGTSTGANDAKFFALNPLTGETFDDYPNGTTDTPPGGLLENVLGMATVDYPGNRVYFGTKATNPGGYTLWSLDLGPIGSPSLSLTATGDLPWNPKPLGSGIGTVGSPVLRNGWLYLDTGSGAAAEMHALRISDGTVHSYIHGDGQAKGFPWPDRRNGRLYFSTTTRVQALYHDGSSLVLDPGWLAAVGGSVTMTNPEIVLQKPGTDELYVGDGTGRLVRLNAANGTWVSEVMLEAGAQIGAPSLDNVNNLLLVGSDRGVIYAVQVGF